MEAFTYIYIAGTSFIYMYYVVWQTSMADGKNR